MQLRRRLATAAGASAVAVLAAAALSACGGSSDNATSATGPASTTPSAPDVANSDETATSTAATDSEAADNGVADKNAEEILTAARTAALAAGAVHVVGELGNTGLDLSLVRGEGAVGTISQGPTRFDIVYVGRAVYLKADDDFYRQLGGEAAVELLAGKWLKVPAGGRDFSQFAQLADMGQLMTQALKPDGAIAKGKAATLDSGKAIGLTNRGGTLFVATTGDPYPLQISQTGGAEGAGKVVFDRWDEPVELSAPADAIDISELERTASSTSN
ncbi:MAG TPA: hypothetical protein VGM91_22475 [Conexibacter sp.]